MKTYGLFFVFWCLCAEIHGAEAECSSPQSVTFERWSGVSPVYGAPVFVYSASGDEESLTGVCLARCRELPDCASVVVEYGRGSCYGIVQNTQIKLRSNSDAAYFRKICLQVEGSCRSRWWAVELTPGYHLHSEGSKLKVILNTSVQDCSEAVLDSNGDSEYRSAQWVAEDSTLDPTGVTVSDAAGTCMLHENDKFTEPESYRVANFNTVYIESQCRHDYPKKIDRCSYEEYFNQTLKHVELTRKNYTRDMCKAACEIEDRFVCRGFTWTPRPDMGLCDLHSEDLVTTGSWLLRRTNTATYYRRVICLNISVECDGSNMSVTYRSRGAFKGRVYVPGRGEECSARATAASGNVVKLSLPLYGNCGVNFAYAISNGPNGVINRTMAYAMLMVQNNPIIQTAGDRWVRVGCSPGARAPALVDATVAVKDTSKPTLASEPPVGNSLSYPAAPSAVFSPSLAPLTMYVVRADESAGAGSVSLGELLELRIETTEAKEIEAYHLVAASRLGDSSVLMLDSRGCPTGQVDFPPFSREWLGATQRLSARFKAFRFPTSHVVRFAIVVRFCEDRCQPVDCRLQQLRSARQTNETNSFDYSEEGIPAAIQEASFAPLAEGVVAQGGRADCGGAGDGKVPLELEMIVGSGDVLSADTLVRADSRSPEEDQPRVSASESSLVCMHELLLVALALAWLAVQVLLLVGCGVLVHRYRNLAEMSLHKDYQSFDNVGFESSSTHRRVHWPDQHLDTLHS